MQRFTPTPFALIRQPRPGDRESRFPAPRDHHFHRPKKEAQPHV